MLRLPQFSRNCRNSDVDAYGPNRVRFKCIDQNKAGTTTTHYVADGPHEATLDGSSTKRKTAFTGGL